MQYLGIDMQTRRDCCYAVINETGKLEKSGWLANPLADVADLVKELHSTSQVAVGIDSPRMPLTSERKCLWIGVKRKWSYRKGQKGYGRHCEIVISAHRLANPQWTPL